jgi:hypothetical protein
VIHYFAGLSHTMKVLLTFIVIAALMSQLGDCVDSSHQKERQPRGGELSGLKNLKQCLEDTDVGGETLRCVPDDKPDDCPSGTWDFLYVYTK